MKNCICKESTEYFDYQMKPFNVLNTSCELHGIVEPHKYDRRHGDFTNEENDFIVEHSNLRIKLILEKFNNKFKKRSEQNLRSRFIWLKAHGLTKVADKVYTPEMRKYLKRIKGLRPAEIRAKLNKKYSSNKSMASIYHVLKSL